MKFQWIIWWLATPFRLVVGIALAIVFFFALLFKNYTFAQEAKVACLGILIGDWNESDS